MLPGITMAVCVAGGLSGYEAPVFEPKLAQVVEAAEKTEAPAEKKTRKKIEKPEQEAAPAKVVGSINLADCADGTYEGSGVGFQNGKTTVKVTIKDHVITAIEVVSHQDTESYFASARSVIDRILSTQSLDVDTVSGATYSSNGIIEAVSNALKRAAGQTVSDNYSGSTGSAASAGPVSVSASTPDQLTDGTYTGSAEGFSGLVTVSVTVSGGKITSVDILSHSDTPSYFSSASVLCDLIVQNNGVNGLDAVSGATYSSRGILQAVANALSGAGGSESVPSAGTAPGNSSSGNGGGTVEIPVAQIPDQLADGTYTGSGEGFGGTTTLSVTVSGGKVTNVKTVSHQDTPSYYDMAVGLLDQIVQNNGISGIDAVSGATYSSRGILQAAAEALSKAGASEDSGNTVPDPADNGSDSGSGKNSKPGKNEDSKPEIIDTDTKVLKGRFPYLDGIYTGSGEGNGGEITVSIIIRDKTLTSVAVLSAEDEDEPFLTQAKGILSDILLSQSFDVDTVSGATYSSEGILDAVKDALSQASALTEQAEKDKKDPSSDEDTDKTEKDEKDAEKDPKEDSGETVIDDNGGSGENPDDYTDDSDGSTDDTEDPALYRYRDGIYNASVLINPGEDGDFLPYTLSMEMTIEKGVITSFDNVEGSGEGYEESDLRYIKRALNGTSKYAGIASQVFEKNGIEDVEAVSGATWTSDAMIEMIREMLLLAENEGMETSE